jgi:hypothetical protein
MVKVVSTSATLPAADGFRSSPWVRTTQFRVPLGEPLWNSDLERFTFFEKVARSAAAAQGQEFADLLAVDDGAPGRLSTIRYLVDDRASR